MVYGLNSKITKKYQKNSLSYIFSSSLKKQSLKNLTKLYNKIQKMWPNPHPFLLAKLFCGLVRGLHVQWKIIQKVKMWFYFFYFWQWHNPPLFLKFNPLGVLNYICSLFFLFPRRGYLFPGQQQQNEIFCNYFFVLVRPYLH